MNIIFATPNNTIKNKRLYIVKYNIYFPRSLEYSFETYLKDIKLAMDAINVPRPPKFVPIINFSYCSVKPESNKAAGTLLIN